MDSVRPLATQLGLNERLDHLIPSLDHGNQAMRWLKAHAEGTSISDLLRLGSLGMQEQELINHGRQATLG